MKKAKVIRVTQSGEVSFVKVEAQRDGDKWPWRATLVLGENVPSEGEMVEFDNSWPQSEKPWKNQDGEWKSGGVKFYMPKWDYAGGAVATAEVAADDSDEIPF